MSDLTHIDVLLAFFLIGSFLISIACHEYAHALVASWLGDPTPKREGRLTLKPAVHIDPLGLLFCVIFAFQAIGLGPVAIGWGKSIGLDPNKLRPSSDRGLLIVALAGPLCNLILGVLFSFIGSFLIRFTLVGYPLEGFTIHILQFVFAFAITNFSLVFLNLIPLYPLDGYNIVYALLPRKQAMKFARSAPSGPAWIMVIFFLVPFILTIARLDFSPYIHLSYLFWSLSINLLALIVGPAGIPVLLPVYNS